MIEYPSIRNTGKYKRIPVMLFDKVDGSNIRAKWTRKGGFKTFGTRTQLVNEDTPFWGDVITLFNESLADKLNTYFSKLKADKLIVFGEFYGHNSFAGRHVDEAHSIVPFDVYDEKIKAFMPPEKFYNELGSIVTIPKVWETNVELNAELIQSVRCGYYGVFEGVICKGLHRDGSFSGGVPMYKIKTTSYLQKLKETFKHDWERYAE
jgi:hypothetical protein